MVAIVRRNQWGARTNVPNRPLVAAARFVVWHYPGGSVGNDGAAVTRAVETQHRNLGWSVAPGYNYLISRDGRIFEGAGLMRGIHSPPRNADGFGVQLMVNIGEHPTAAQRNSGRALYLWLNGQARRTLTPWWHSRDWSTACPAPQVIAWVRAGMPAAAPPPPPPPPPPPRPAPSLNGMRPVMHVVFDDANRAVIGLPNNITSLRLASTGARVRTSWPGSRAAAREDDLNPTRRADVPRPGDQQGLVMVERLSGEGPVYLSWLEPVR